MATHAGGLTADPGTRVRDHAPAAVRTSGLVRRFGDRTVLKELDLTIGAGEFTALLGRSGSGKSTLLRAVAGLDHDVEGSGGLTVPERVSSPSRTPACCPGCGSWTTSPSDCTDPASANAEYGPSPRSAWRAGSVPGPTSCPAANSSVPPWPAPW